MSRLQVIKKRLASLLDKSFQDPTNALFFTPEQDYGKNYGRIDAVAD